MVWELEDNVSVKDELRITRLDDNISYIEPTVNPLSANVVISNAKMQCGCMMLAVIQIYLICCMII